MALDLELDSLDGIDERFHSEYKKGDDGKYRLDVSGLPDVNGLKSALEKEREFRRDYEKQFKSANDELEKLKLDSLKKGGKNDDLIKTYEEKVNNIKSDYESKLSELNNYVKNSAVDSEAAKIASKLARAVKGVDGKDYSTYETLFEIVKHRMTAEVKDGQTKVIILDKSGKPSLTSTDEFLTELRNTPSLMPLIAGTGASGANNQAHGNGGSLTGKLFRSEMSAIQIKEFIDKNGRDKYLALPAKRPKGD